MTPHTWRRTYATILDVEMMIGFDRVTPWALARQGRLFAELAALRPTDPVPYVDGSANVGDDSRSGAVFRTRPSRRRRGG